MEFTADAKFQAVFWTVVLVRFFLPFLIFPFPLPAVVACMIVDAADQTIFQWFGYDPPFYQGYDKAMDVFYLGIAYVSTLRSWQSLPAFNISRFLFFYRQIGVVAFELTQVRALLLIFPNTFEYFFIAYEAIATRWSPLRLVMKGWLLLAAFIWIVIKLPQEYWIHIAQLDFTETLQDVPWFGPLVVAAIVALLAMFWFVIRPRLAPPDHGWRFGAPPVPEPVRTAAQRAALLARVGRVWSQASLEKALLIGLLSVIFTSILPTVDPSPLRLMLWIAGLVLVNAGIGLALARRGRSTESVLRTLALHVVGNFALVLVTDLFIDQDIPRVDALFFVLLFSVLVTVYDRYRPIYEWRREGGQEPGIAPVAAAEAR